MKIIYYEMRKSWLKITTFVVLIIFTGLSVIRMNDICRTKYSQTYGDLGEAYFRIYETLCGELTEEKVAPFRQRAKELKDEVLDLVYSHEYQPEKYPYTGYAWGDFMLHNAEISPEITYCVTYPNTSNSIAASAVDDYYFYAKVGNDFEAEKNAMIYRIFQNRYIPEYRATYWTYLFFQYDFSSLLCIVMLILGLSASFTSERESGMFQLITASGKMRKTVCAKIFSAAIYCAFLTVYFTLCDLISTHILLGINGLNMPIYSAELFERSPFTFSFWTAIFMWVGVRFLALFSIALMILLISNIAPNTIISMVGSFGISLILILLTAVSGSALNPVCALVPNAYMEEFSVVNIFGQPVLKLFAAIIALAAECIFLCVVVALSRRILRR